MILDDIKEVLAQLVSEIRGDNQKDIRAGYLADLRDGKNKRRYYKHYGRKKAFYIHATDPDGKSHTLQITSAWDDTVDRVRATARVQGNRKVKKAKLRAPEDLKKLKAFKDVLLGKPLDYSYLSDLENRMLTMRTLGN